MQKEVISSIRKRDLTNMKFGRLLAIRPTEDKYRGNVIWEFICDCGNTVCIPSGRVVNGSTSSCGCFKKECLKNRNANGAYDLKNMTFGNLYVLKKSNVVDNCGIYWECLCKCGNTLNVSASNLITGRIKSCGCVLSKGEFIIAKLLNQYNIKYIPQYKFKDLLSSKNYNLRFDFGILDNQSKLEYLIECDGDHHRNKKHIYYSEEIIKNDIVKNNYCLTNKIPLIRIPYDGRKTIITIDDLLLNKSKYLYIKG